MPRGSRHGRGDRRWRGHVLGGAGAGRPARHRGGQSGSGQAGAGTSKTEAPARTGGESRAEIDRQLDASLGEFDEELRREQQRTAEQRDSRGTSGSGNGAVAEATGEDTDRDDDDQELVRNRAGDLQSEGAYDAARSGSGNSGSASGTGADAKGPGTGGSMGGGGGGVSAREIPSGQDDDIIARRLRKAAEAETDPELKEKLWREYIDYKENTQRG